MGHVIKWVVAAGAISLLGGCGSSDAGDVATDEPTERLSTSTSPSTQPDRPATTEASAAPLPLSGLIEPGTHTTNNFDPQLQLSFADANWSIPMEDRVDSLFLDFQADPTGAIWDARYASVQVLTNTFDDPFLPQPVLASAARTEHLLPIPEDVPGWLRSLGATVTEPEELTLSGRPAQRFDVAWEDLPDEAAAACPAGLPPGHDRCVTLFSVEGDAESITTTPALGVRERWTVVAAGDARILLVAGGPKDVFDEFAPQAQTMLDTVVIS